MKKISIIMVACIAGLCIASCRSKSNGEVAKEDSLVVKTEELADTMQAGVDCQLPEDTILVDTLEALAEEPQGK